MRIKDYTDMVGHLTDSFNIPEARRMIEENPALSREQFAEGQLVQPGPGRQGYKGDRQTSAEKKATYYKKLLENLPEGYYDEYVENFYTVNKETEKLSHVSGGPEGKGIPYMEKKYGDIITKTYKTRQGETTNLNRKIRDINAAIKQNISDKIESGLKEGRKIRKADLQIIGNWYPKSPEGKVTHHFMPTAGIEGEGLNLASTKNTAFISKELNSKMAPYDTKLKANQKEQIKLLKEKSQGWEKKIEELNFKAKNDYKDAAKKVPGSKGYLGYSQYIKQPDGSYVPKVTGIDPNKSLAGLDGEEIFYKNISPENKLKVNKMSNIVELSSKKTVPKIVRPKFVSFPANLADVKLSKAVKGWRGGALFEILFGTLDYWNEQSKGKEGGWGGQAMANAIQTASFGILKTGDKKYVYELLRLGKEMGFDTTALEHVIDINKRDNVLAKVEASNVSHLEAIKKKIDKTTDPEMKEKLQEIYNERKIKFATRERERAEETNKIFDTYIEDLRAKKAGPVQLVSPEKLAATDITQEEADLPFENLWTTATEQLRQEKESVFPEASKRLDYEAGVIGDPLQTHIFNVPAWTAEHEAFGLWNKTPKQEERARLNSLIKLAEEGNPEPLREYNERRGVYEDQPITTQSLKNLTERYPWLGYRLEEAEGGIASLKKK